MGLDDPEFTGEALRRLVIDIQATVGRHEAGLTPLGAAVVRLAQDAFERDRSALSKARGESQ
jgi:hypothetical protein